MHNSRKIIKAILIILCFKLIVVGCKDRLFYYSKSRNEIVEYKHINDSTLTLTGVSEDRHFGFEAERPIMIGVYDVHKGAKNIEKYLNALQGPNSEKILYKRLKPCCPFKTKNFTYKYEDLYPEKNMDEFPMINGEFSGNRGMLEKYRVEYTAGFETYSFILYFNLYDETKVLLAPYGFSYKKD